MLIIYHQIWSTVTNEQISPFFPVMPCLQTVPEDEGKAGATATRQSTADSSHSSATSSGCQRRASAYATAGSRRQRRQRQRRNAVSVLGSKPEHIHDVDQQVDHFKANEQPRSHFSKGNAKSCCVFATTQLHASIRKNLVQYQIRIEIEMKLSHFDYSFAVHNICCLRHWETDSIGLTILSVVIFRGLFLLNNALRSSYSPYSLALPKLPKLGTEFFNYFCSAKCPYQILSF